MQEISVSYADAEINSQQPIFKVEDNFQSANQHSDDLTQAQHSLKRFLAIQWNKLFPQYAVRQGSSVLDIFLLVRGKHCQAESSLFELYGGDAKLTRLLQKRFTFLIDKDLGSQATRVMFNNRDKTRQQICLKMWLKCHNDLYQTEDLSEQTEFLLDGLAFNRRFSRSIYYGIAPISFNGKRKIKCGPLIENPTLEKLSFKKPYALIMKRLKDECRLDNRLYPGMLGNAAGMEFLAHQVAEIHQKLNRSFPELGTPERISDKLEFNIEQFRRALDERKGNAQIIATSRFSETDIKWIESASIFLRQLGKAHQHDFKKRRREGHIKRCHGDLKAANLWICPSENESQAQERLVALDCIDFNPEFCNIDTLSDVAMLAVDLEMRLDKATGNRDVKLSVNAQQLARHFLQTYLKAAGEHETVWPLLEYYMTEKAMVCAYMSILYDDLPSLGEDYLKVVLVHSQELAKFLPPHVGKRITKPLNSVTN